MLKLVAVACISASVLLVELGITRLFSVITWGHFAFLAVSIALFGLSASAVFIHVTRIGRDLANQFWGYAVAACGATLLLAFTLLRTRLGEGFSSPDLIPLLEIYFLAAAPFFAAGACLTLVISRLHANINRVYAADLGGAAAGCLIFIPALNILGGPGPLLLSALLSCVAAACFVESRTRRLIAMAAGVAVLALTITHARTDILDIRYTKHVTGLAERTAIFTKWNSHSRIGVYPEQHGDWGISARYTGPHPRTMYLDIDASASTPILLAKTVDDVAFLHFEVTAFAYRLLPKGGETLVIGPGGGRDVWSGLLYGASHVTGVEVNSIIVEDVMKGKFADASGHLYQRPDVTVFVDDARNFVARSTQSFNLIQASLVDTWAATAAGALSLTENNLYTVEAFVEYLSHLKSNGVLSMSRWSPDVMRVISLARAASEQLHLDLAHQLFVVEAIPPHGGVAVSTVIVKKSPFTDDEIARLKQAATDLGFGILYSPTGEGREDFRELVSTRDLAGFLAKQESDVSPVYDDRPFFFQATKREEFPAILRDAVTSGATDGLNVIARLLIVSLAAVLLFILLPLLIARRANRQSLSAPAIGLFGSLGVGFMLIEIGLMQRFVLFLGHPVYALTVVLFALLLGGGLGSRLSARLTHDRVLRLAPAAVVVLALVYAFGLPLLFGATLGLSRVARITLVFALLMPLGMSLGSVLPAAIARVATRHTDELAWAWAINGATSVLGSVVAMTLALLFGFRATVCAGAACYVIALLLTVKLRPTT